MKILMDLDQKQLYYTYIQTFMVYILSVPLYYHVHTNVYGLHSGIHIFDIMLPIMSVSHMHVHCTNSGCEKRAAHKNRSIGFPE